MYTLGIIDELAPDYNPAVYVTCPICTTKLKSDDLTIIREEKGEEKSHINTLLIENEMSNKPKQSKKSESREQ